MGYTVTRMSCKIITLKYLILYIPCQSSYFKQEVLTTIQSKYFGYENLNGNVNHVTLFQLNIFSYFC